MADSCYEKIWAEDQLQGEQRQDGVETVEAVLQRGLEILERLEPGYEGAVLLLVSHGDMVQILQTAFAGIAASDYRQLPHHQTAEIKRLVSLGEPRSPGFD